ncbi:MAG: hypothetical protein HFJ91_02590 [Muribaculaceae bacterium]|nr:hypothetical protein [Muribaculaceae bacterium]
MNQSDYTPSPIDTSGIELPDDLIQLAETLAENVHEVWSKVKLGFKIVKE